MTRRMLLSKTITATLIYSRPLLVFGGMFCAVGVMWNQSPGLYLLGLSLLLSSMMIDLIDGWFSVRFESHPALAGLADRIMDKVLFSILFPLIAVGMMWRLSTGAPDTTQIELLHAIFVMFLCIVALIRDNIASFMRQFSTQAGHEPESPNTTRLRTILAAPLGALLYAYAFHVPNGPDNVLYRLTDGIAMVPIRGLLLIEIAFVVVSFASIASYCKKYGKGCLDELCLGDEHLRRKILAVFPNALTLMNGIMGLLAVFFTYKGRVQEAYLILIGATIFDKLDGALARRLGLTEPLPGAESHITAGSIMDDLADGLSFCAVPAWMFYITMSRVDHPLLANWLLPLAVLYTFLGIARLIYFILDQNSVPGFFKGMPVPAAATLVAAPLVMLDQALTSNSSWIGFWYIFSTVLMFVAMVLMNSYHIRYIHLGRFMSRTPWFGRFSLAGLIVMSFTPYIGYAALAFLCCYVLSPLVTGRVDPIIAARETS